MIFWKLVRYLCGKIIAKHTPKIIVVSGSLGKSSTKSAICELLSHHFDVRETYKNFNTESGVALGILGTHKGAGIAGKFNVMAAICKNYFSSSFPEVLVLELAIDHKGDMDFFGPFFPNGVDVAVLTNISPVHLENFNNFDEIIAEKAKIFGFLAPDGLAVMNIDNKHIAGLYDSIPQAKMTIGTEEGANISYKDVKINLEGTSFVYEMKGVAEVRRTMRTSALGCFIPLVALPALAVARHFQISFEDIDKAIGDYSSPSGRMNLLRKEDGVVVLDGSYNASPGTVHSALATMADLHTDPYFKDSTKIAVLGDMLELGENEFMAHVNKIKEAYEYADTVVLIGPLFTAAFSHVKDSFELAEETFPKTIVYDCATVAIEQSYEWMEKNALILIKGSNSMGLASIVSSIK